MAKPDFQELASKHEKAIALSIAGVGLLGTLVVPLLVADLPKMAQRYQYQKTYCEYDDLFAVGVCRDRPVSEVHLGEVVYQGDRYTLTYQPLVGRSSPLKIRPRRVLGITGLNIDGDGDIQKATEDLEAKGCEFDPQFITGGEKVRKIIIKRDFPDPPILTGAIAFIKDSTCFPV